MVGHGGSRAGSYLADPTSPIPSHCASIVVTSTLRVNAVGSHPGQCICPVTLIHVRVGTDTWQISQSEAIWHSSMQQSVLTHDRSASQRPCDIHPCDSQYWDITNQSVRGQWTKSRYDNAIWRLKPLQWFSYTLLIIPHRMWHILGRYIALTLKEKFLSRVRCMADF